MVENKKTDFYETSNYRKLWNEIRIKEKEVLCRVAFQSSRRILETRNNEFFSVITAIVVPLIYGLTIQYWADWINWTIYQIFTLTLLSLQMAGFQYLFNQLSPPLQELLVSLLEPVRMQMSRSDVVETKRKLKSWLLYCAGVIWTLPVMGFRYWR